jgi:hypothetical protein
MKDDIGEGDDNFNIQLTRPNGCLLGTTAYECIIFNDATLISITDAGYSPPTTYSVINLV